MPIIARVAVALFAVGLLAIVAVFATPLLTDHEPSLGLYLLSLAAPVGLGVGVIHALRAGRRQR